jgi:hypothetical protein
MIDQHILVHEAPIMLMIWKRMKSPDATLANCEYPEKTSVERTDVRRSDVSDSKSHALILTAWNEEGPNQETSVDDQFHRDEVVGEAPSRARLGAEAAHERLEEEERRDAEARAEDHLVPSTRRISVSIAVAERAE